MLSEPIIVARCDNRACPETLHIPFPKVGWPQAVIRRFAETGWIADGDQHFCCEKCKEAK